MFKFLMLAVFLWQNLPCISAEPKPFFRLNYPVASDTSKHLTAEPEAKYSFRATHQTFYFNGPIVINGPTDSNNAVEAIRSDYKVSKGIGAHKLHLRKLSWNKARRTCHEEGGHLAIIRSDAEEKIVQKMMHQDAVASAWIGFHDTFEEDDWVSVLDEPLDEIGWSAWSTKLGHKNPDNSGGNENCAEYRRDADGINDATCAMELPFVCKISTS